MDGTLDPTEMGDPAPSASNSLIAAFARGIATDIARGVPGSATASELVAALPAAWAKQLPDLTGSAPELFAELVRHGVLPSRPSAGVMSAALALIAAVCPLIERRSARRWTIWLARARDQGSPLADAIQRRAGAAAAAVATTASASPRPTTIRAERDAIARDLAVSRADRDRVLAEHVESRRAHDECLYELTVARDARRALEAEASRSAEAMEYAITENTRTNTELARLVDERNQLAAQVATMSASNRTLAADLATSRAERDQTAAELQAATAAARRLGDRNAELAAQANEAKQASAKATRQLETTIAERRRQLDATTADLQGERAALELVRLTEARTSADLYRLIKEHTRSRDLAASPSAAQQQLAAQKRLADAVEAELQEKKAQIQRLEASQRSLDAELAATSKEHARVIQVHEVIISNAKYGRETAEAKAKELSEALERAKDALQDQHDRHKRDIDKLTARILPLWEQYLQLRAETEVRRAQHPTSPALQASINARMRELVSKPPPFPS